VNPESSRLRIADRKLERVTELNDFRRVICPVYPRSGLTPDGAPLLLRDIHAGSLRARLRSTLSTIPLLQKYGARASSANVYRQSWSDDGQL
jgi:hypothetical protein